MRKVGGNHQPICLDLKFSKIYMIWIGDDVDTVLLNDEGKIIAYKSIDAIKAFALSASIDFKNNLFVYDAYIIQQWLLSTDKYIDCDLFLNVWNLFTDIAASLQISFLGDLKTDISNSLYDKLFNGADTIISDNPDSDFNKEERIELAKIMQDGFYSLSNALAIK